MESIEISADLLAALDRAVGEGRSASRAALVEEALRAHLAAPAPLPGPPAPGMLTPAQREVLADWSRGAVTAHEARLRLGGATFGELLILLGAQGLPLPRAPVAGREEAIARARAWLFPDDAG